MRLNGPHINDVTIRNTSYDCVLKYCHIEIHNLWTEFFKSINIEEHLTLILINYFIGKLFVLRIMAKELSKDYANYFINSDISNEVTIIF